ncbi:transcriptional regulator [Actinomadura sp. DSM 109109]|nr:transcriptional regulator [Actinomadura lepetitiana]
MTSPAESLVLHALRCAGHAGTPRVADAAGLAEADAESHLIDLAVAGLVTRSPGVGGAWGLTGEGRAEDARRTARELDAAGARDALLALYGRFMVLNPELLELCSAWQLRPETGAAGTVAPNDHSDPAYDARVLGRFADLDRRAEVVGTELSALLPRFGRYRVRLAAALARVRSGELEHLTDSTTSYHAVWFQLHEDLLATLGMPRW